MLEYIVPLQKQDDYQTSDQVDIWYKADEKYWSIVGLQCFQKW